MAARAEQRRNSQRRQDSTLPQKRKEVDQHRNNRNKRTKRDEEDISEMPDKETRLADIITRFNLARNELFQLKEYKSLAYWNPSDFSTALLTSIPELYESFLKDPKNQLQWDEELQSHDLSNLPLRLQKKVVAETERKLLEKFPYKEKVEKMSLAKEAELIENAKLASEQSIKGKISKPIPKSKAKAQIPKGNKRPSRANGHIETEEVDESSDETINTNYKLKAIKYSLPTPLVTHPSHIPAWRPDPAHTESTLVSSSKNIINFNPTPITYVKQGKSWEIEQDIQSRISNFLDSNYRSAILDEPTDYNNTAEEYDRILLQQQELFRKLRQKTEVDNTLQLHGDKIELRKAVLPQSNNNKVQDPYRSTGSVVPKIQGAANNLTYHDHFVNQGMAFSKIHQHMRRQHQVRTKKIAQMIEQHFKKKKGEKDRLARERELNLKKISRLAVQSVKKRWSQANKVYLYIQQQKEEELKQIKGREHLSQMLEHSTQLLEAQLSKGPERESSEEQEDPSNSDDALSSSDESEPEVNGEIIGDEDTNDMSLSVEQLRLKYANLEESISRTGSPEIDSDDESENDVEIEEEDSDSDIDVDQGLSALYGGSSVTPETKVEAEYTEEQKKLIAQLTEENGNDILASDSASDSSLDSDSDSGTDLDQEAESETSSIEPKSNGGLASLFGSLKEESDNEDFDESDSANDDDENMSSDEELIKEEGKELVEINGNGTLENGNHDVKDEPVKEEIINGAKVKDVPLPPLLRGTLRPYQKQGLNWLASLYNNNTNGILADEMGLGKTIQTISLLSYLASEHHIWGPHLIVVPTSVMLNWEMEFKKFAPGFKVMTYYGSPQQRAAKRKGWNLPNAFHVCITSYQLVVHDHQSFKRRRWKYMILDEAHNIKNFRSTRWKALLNFNTENRLLLTGTPLQNNLMELWSLLYFLMPSSKMNQAMPEGFANLEDFQQWFGRPVDRILEQNSIQGGPDVIDENESTTKKLDAETRNTVARLHQVLRPYLLRRLKKDVEKQMPGKYEHIVYCRLSKRQRFLYDDFMSRAKTKETLASGNFLSIINCLMQLRKVCNHPDLFEVRPIVTSFAIPKSVPNTFQSSNNVVRKLLTDDCFDDSTWKVDLKVLNLDITGSDNLNHFVSQSAAALQSTKLLQDQIDQLDSQIAIAKKYNDPDLTNYLEYYQYIKANDQIGVRERLHHVLYLNSLRCGRKPIYGESLIRFLTSKPRKPIPTTDIFASFQVSIPQRVEQMGDIIDKYSVLTPPIVALDMKDHLIPTETQYRVMEDVSAKKIDNPFSRSQTKLSIAFPDKSLLQYDCGKLQKLATLLQDLVSKGHRALIFTQMTKVLDILEQFLNIHGYRYSRLDGATKIEDRQLLTERFNRDNKIPVFILSTRSGGLGINLTGADTVIFYDSDWNPAMDKQCQDRCHRIGQIRDVHIYRFVSEYTIESNILKKANQKRQLDNVVIQEGEFTTDYFGKFSVRDLVNDTGIADEVSDQPLLPAEGNVDNILAQAEDDDDREAASAAMKEVAIDDEDFDEESKSVTATAGATPSQTPGPESSLSVATNGDVPKNPGEQVDLDFAEGIGHIDEYMLRFISEGYYWD